MSGTATSGGKPNIIQNSKVSHRNAEDARRNDTVAQFNEVDTILNPPFYLTPGAKKEWRRIITLYEKVKLQILNDLDTEALANYCLEVDMRVKLYKKWKNEQKCALTTEELRVSEMESEKNSSTTTTKQEKINPIIKQIMQLDETIRKHAEQLGLTPVGRAAYAVRIEKKRNPIEEMQATFGDIDFNDLN